MKIFFYKTIVGKLGIVENNQAIERIYFEKRYLFEKYLNDFKYKKEETPIIKKLLMRFMNILMEN